MEKVIHYCWFGQNPLPESAIKCIDSWKKFCPDYQIKEWNESNFDFSQCKYAVRACELKKYAFLSDYARFKILYEYGGVYLDTDVELIKGLDEIVEKGPFMGCEGNYAVASGLGIGAEPKMEIYKELVELYENIDFEKDDGSSNVKTVVDYVTEVFTKYGFKKTDEIQLIKGVYVYPQEYFCPKDVDSGALNITDNTVSIHHYDASWFSDSERYAQVLRKKYRKFLPSKLAGRLAYFVAQCKYIGFRKAVKNTMRKLKKK